jgi:hypothetical protein
MKQVIYADTWRELILKMSVYHHDHCWHFYSGRTDNVPEKYREFVTENYEFVFIYEEDTPIDTMKNGRET